MPNFFFFNDTATTEIYTLSLHDALPIWSQRRNDAQGTRRRRFRSRGCASHAHAKGGGLYRSAGRRRQGRSEEHTSELQSPCNLVCRLLLEKKKKESKRAERCDIDNLAHT